MGKTKVRNFFAHPENFDFRGGRNFFFALPEKVIFGVGETRFFALPENEKDSLTRCVCVQVRI